MAQSTIVWTQGGNTLTWTGGGIETSPEDYLSTVLSDRLAGGAIDVEDLGVGPLKTRHFLFPFVTDAIKGNFVTWRDTTVNGPYVVFTHTDNSQSTPEAISVRLVDSHVRRRTDQPGTTPVWDVLAALQVEP